MTKKSVYIFLVLLITAICLSPRFSFGHILSGKSIDVRAEDAVLCFGLIVWFFYVLISGVYKFKSPPLFRPILFLLGWGFFCILVNLLLGRIFLDTAFFYFLKEIEFFLLYFIVFYCVSNFGSSKKLIKYWLFFGIVNVLWLIYVFIFNVKWSIFYGPEAFMEPKGPFPSGGFFALIFIFFFNLFIFYYNKLQISKIKKVSLFILCFLPIFGVMSSGSMASTLGAFFSIPVSLFLLFKNKINFSRFIKFIILAAVIIGVLLLAIYTLPIPQKIVSLKKIVFEYTSGSSTSRGKIFENNLITFSEHPENLIIGIGIYGEAHSQYMRVFLERGIIGLFLFFGLIWSILKISYTGFKEKNDLFKKGLCAGLFVSTIAMMVMAIPNDSFMIVKPDEVYWFFAAMAVASISTSKESV